MSGVGDRELARRFLERKPDASAPELAGALSITPPKATELLDDVQPDVELETSPESTDTVPPIAGGKKIVSDGCHVPTDLREYPQDIWVLWAPENGKTALAPWQEGHMYPAEWAAGGGKNPRRSYEKAKMVADLPPEEIARTWPFPDGEPAEVKPAVLTPPMWRDEPLTFVDYDDVRDENGRVTPEVWELMKAFGGPAEISRSGEGIHQWVRGELPGELGKFIADLEGVGQIEMYDTGRMTGGTWRHVRGTPKDEIPDAQNAIERVVSEYGDDRQRIRAFDDTPDDEERSVGDVLKELRGGGDAGRNRSPYYDLDTKAVADTGAFRNYRNDSSNPSPDEWQGPHPSHGGTSARDKESTNFNVDGDVWHCFAHSDGGGALELIAVMENVVSCGGSGKIHSDPVKMLKTCLYARDSYATDLEGVKPPYAALVGVAKSADLTMADADDEILGEHTHKLAQHIYTEMDPSDV